MDNLIISISGIRGIVGESLTEKDSYTSTGLFFKTYLKRQKGQLKLIVGRDIKPTGELLLKGAIASLLAHGVKNVENLGITSLPAMEWAVNHFRASGGIFITASHNPMEWNGIKFISSFQDGGSLLPASAMEKIKDGWRSEVNKIKKREI
ncbi:MAG TPA: hypothetical protein EYP78_04245, partial [Candidatus Omnitrophica bacterium]|nr:hypothetical protein [Candidatus Omnitrophota bacterium]